MTDRFTIKFWGVRGSIPVPGPDTVRYGGNTTCVEVRCGDTIIIIDAGSGIRNLGKALLQCEAPLSVNVLMTHVHWDHIQGFPFFSPAFVPSTDITVWSEAEPKRPVFDVLNQQMSGPMFPVNLTDMQGTLDFRTFRLGEEWAIGDVRIRTSPLNHPGGATAYRIDYAGHSYVHASDHEHTCLPYNPLIELCRAADCLVYDAAYTEDEYRGVGSAESLEGWGHSTWQEGVLVAQAAKVRSLLLFQHHYDRTDDELDILGQQAAQAWPGALFSREGMEVDLLAGTITHPLLPKVVRIEAP